MLSLVACYRINTYSKEFRCQHAIEFKDAITIGRTHLMDALPVTLGIEFGERAYSLEIAKKKPYQAVDNLTYIGLGGTAVGSGVNSPRGFRQLVISLFSEISGLDLKPSPNVYYCLQSKFDVANCSSALRNLALELIKIANDLRLMASGPNAGFAEIVIPALHPGSSVMPGKVNPSLAECLDMICFNIVGNDVSVAMAAQAGQFELEVMLPGMTKNVLDSAKMLKNFLPKFAKKMVDGIEASRQRIESQVDKSPILVTLLNPHIGYLKAAEIYKESMETGISIRQLVLSRGLMSKDNLLGGTERGYSTSSKLCVLFSLSKCWIVFSIGRLMRLCRDGDSPVNCPLGAAHVSSVSSYGPWDINN